MAVLVLEKGKKSAGLVLNGSAVIGRVPGLDMTIRADGVSRLHARVFREDGKYFIEDLGSRNGTFVDKRRVQGRVQLSPGEVIRVGAAKISFRSISKLPPGIKPIDHREDDDTVVVFRCGVCKSVLRAERSRVGAAGRCVSCKARIIIPDIPAAEGVAQEADESHLNDATDEQMPLTDQRVTAPEPPGPAESIPDVKVPHRQPAQPATPRAVTHDDMGELDDGVEALMTEVEHIEASLVAHDDEDEDLVTPGGLDAHDDDDTDDENDDSDLFVASHELPSQLDDTATDDIDTSVTSTPAVATPDDAQPQDDEIADIAASVSDDDDQPAPSADDTGAGGVAVVEGDADDSADTLIGMAAVDGKAALDAGVPAPATGHDTGEIEWLDEEGGEVKTRTLGTCAVCRHDVASDDEHVYCGSCRTLHHAECWQENFGCATYGCSNVNCLEPRKPLSSDESVDEGDSAAKKKVKKRDAGTPWDWFLMAASAFSLLLSLFTLGIPSAIVFIGTLVYLFRKKTRKVSILAITFTLLLSLAGIALGIAASWMVVKLGWINA